MIFSSSMPSMPSSPACGLRPATASRGLRMPKSRLSAVTMISSVSNTACLLMAAGTSATGRWMVSGTTRSFSLASIITARRAPVSAARNSVWPGWGKPAWFSTALLIGAVTRAAAQPLTQALTARSMAPVTASALSASILPGMAFTRAWVGMTCSRWDANSAGSPTSRSGRPPMRPPKCSKAARATSGPMPAGSPMVMRIGAARSIYRPRGPAKEPGSLPDKGIGLGVVVHLDIGFALQVAQVPPRQGRDLVLEELVFHLLLGRHHIGGLDLDALVATADQFDTGIVHEGPGGLAGVGVLQAFLDLRGQLVELGIAQIHIDGAAHLLVQLVELGATGVTVMDLLGHLHDLLDLFFGSARIDGEQQAR